MDVKKKGWFRTEAVAPFSIVAGLLVLYTIFFLDDHLRRGVEIAGTYINGAEVNVADLETGFVAGTFKMTGIQVTDPREPDYNRAQIGEVSFDLLWDALLRAKVVIERSAVREIGAHVKRERPGRVLTAEEKASALGQARQKVLENIRERMQQSTFGKIAALLEGFDPSKKIQEIKGDLKTLERINDLDRDLAEKEKAWKQTLDQIPGEKDLSALQSKVASIRVGGSKNPVEIKKQISDLQSVLGETQSKLKAVETQGSKLQGDVSSFGRSVGELDEIAKQDRARLESQLSIPSVSPSNLSEELFSDLVLSRLGEYEHYVTVAREHMPAKGKDGKAEPKKADVRKPRRAGRDYLFGRPHAYPSFWLKRLDLSSSAGENPFSGNVKGEITDITSDQPLLGVPTRLQMRGDFPKQNLSGVALAAVFDHRGEKPRDTLRASVASFPIANSWITQSEGFKLGFEQARGSMEAEGEFDGESVSLGLRSRFSDVKYMMGAQSSALQAIVQDVIRSVPVVEVGARVRGSFEKPAISIESNLATALSRGVQAQLDAKLKDARQRIDALVDERVSDKKKKLTDRYQAVQGRILGQVEARRAQVTQIQAQAQSKIDQAQRQLIQPAAPKAVQGVKKRFGF